MNPTLYLISLTLLSLLHTSHQQLGDFACSRNPSIGSPINYIHKGFEEMYNRLYSPNISAIPRQILDYTEKDSQTQHYAYYLPDSPTSSFMYFSMGNIYNSRPSMENFFFSVADDNISASSRINQILQVLSATKLDGPTRQPARFQLDRTGINIAELNVDCPNIKGSFQQFQKQHGQNLFKLVSNFS